MRQIITASLAHLRHGFDAPSRVLPSVGATLCDTMNIALATVPVLLVLAVIGLGAAALGKPLRLFSIASIVALAVGLWPVGDPESA